MQLVLPITITITFKWNKCMINYIHFEKPLLCPIPHIGSGTLSTDWLSIGDKLGSNNNRNGKKLLFVPTTRASTI